ncbi:thioredoxin family protein [Poseidonibacter ostreae]|jgi:thioredoxin-related protein|uniref:Thioredoxin fold domain-containing protein n=1 Tax=Poseidonibacter ostreae TaxID=2654171 RepID=A0A6L4WQR2_9BACT|nr:thioredoxin fold domain-containing protein [Poseidonibacter ostreae]KAB7887235.1 thioredoxin fold domain-containing protein [Poseidonibacter ostreae]KAB7888292.1 thioredoxin fold domain-containing protein [Poseidonibacter ostreae]KAB7889506.1 thioredoxin fold domain-containing protein [Poseidonibacter ostreae]MAC82900.1 thioredoxin family protein [Arcobacter sp.]|tara:strand:+ start:10136 stop:10519 length:384 start_codon:yes stop_codon:yes gene_type:complete
MKLLLLISFLTFNLFAGSINFEKDLSTAKQKAIDLNKKLMIMYSTPTCPECNYMKKKVLKDKEIVSFVNENFVSVIMDIKEDEKILPYKFIGIPTFYFADASNMKLLSKKIGGTREKQFLEIIKNVK